MSTETNVVEQENTCFGRNSLKKLMDKSHCVNVPRQPSGMALTALTAVGAIAMAAALLLSGCATPGNVHPQSTAIAPESVGLQGVASAVVADTWWKSFNEPQLDALVDKAVQGSPSLRLAQVRVQRAQALIDTLGTNDKPQIGSVADVTRERITANSIYPPPFGGGVFNVGELHLTGSWELDFFGKNRAALDAAIGQQRASQADAQAARIMLAANVARSYFQLARLQEQHAVAQRSLDQRTAILSLIRQRVEAGLDTSVELREGEGSLPEIRQQMEAIDEQMALTRHALAALTSQPYDALDTLAPSLQLVSAVPVPARVPADLLGRRADIEAARLRVEATTQDLKSARASFYPSVNLTAFLGFGAFGLSNLIEASSREWGVEPAVHLPIFDAGRLRANYAGRASDVDAAVESYNGAVIDAVHDVADQIASLQSVDRQIAQQNEAQTAAEQAYDLATQRYKAGLGTYLTVLTAETNVLSQRRINADLKARTLDGQVLLARALGGGYVAAPAAAPVAQAAPRSVVATAAVQ